jgi:xylulokinase
MDYVLGVDIGTTSTIGILIGSDDRIVGPVTRPVSLSSPQAGWAEEDPLQWWANVKSILQKFISRGIALSDIKAVGVAGMVPAVILLDEDGRLLRPSIQQSDARCGVEVDDLRREVDEAAFVSRAGNGINQQLVSAKLRWIEKNEPSVFARIATVLGSYDFINWCLTGERAIEQNWALEAGFVEIATDGIADDLVALAHIMRRSLPRKVASHEILGTVTAQAAEETGLVAGTLVVGGGADHIASALAAGVTRKGDVLLKFGGSIDILIATPHARPDPRMYLDYHLVPGLYMPNGCMATGGSGLNWFAKTFARYERIEAEKAGISIHQRLEQLAEAVPAGAEGLTILPYLLGEKTPIHDPKARGVFSGLDLSHTIGHLWRALLEGYGYAIAHHVEVLKNMGHPLERYLASDGGSKSRVWMQIVSDILQEPIQLLHGHPGSCLGAAWTAAVGSGRASDWDGVSRFIGVDTLIAPNLANAEVYARGYETFRSLYHAQRAVAS